MDFTLFYFRSIVIEFLTTAVTRHARAAPDVADQLSVMARREKDTTPAFLCNQPRRIA
jgi:hypothetical protein